MSNAPHDQNSVFAKMGILFSDGETAIPIAINPSTGGVKVNTTDTVTAPILVAVANRMRRDGDYRPTWAGVSSSSSSTVLPVFVDTDGAVLIDT